MIKKFFVSFTSLLIFASPITFISCGTPPGLGMIFDFNKYFANTDYEMVDQFKNGNLGNGMIPFLSNNIEENNDNLYFQRNDWDVFESYKNVISDGTMKYVPTAVNLKKKSTQEKNLFIGIIKPPNDKELLIKKYYPIKHYWWEYFDLFKSKTGFYPYYEGEIDENGQGMQEYTDWMQKYRVSTFTYIDQEPKYNFLFYNGITKQKFSFIATPSKDELVFEDEFASLKDGEKIMNWEFFYGL